MATPLGEQVRIFRGWPADERVYEYDRDYGGDVMSPDVDLTLPDNGEFSESDRERVGE